MKRIRLAFLPLLLCLLILPGCAVDVSLLNPEEPSSVTLREIPPYSTEAYVVLNDNEPNFTEKDMNTKSFETYSELDELGRCGAAFANIGTELMPTEERKSIGSVKPSGWQTTRYDCVDGKYLYNRCHLIGYQLTAENANKQNLITGTRYLNVTGMLPFEDMVADYIHETGNHVLYRVTPIFDGDNLVASGVEMEAKSVEDNGEAILFHVYCYNVQPFVSIDYATGNSWLTAEGESNISASKPQKVTYILNSSSKKFHKPDCSSAQKVKENNKQEYTGTRETLIADGYSPCGTCKP